MKWITFNSKIRQRPGLVPDMLLETKLDLTWVNKANLDTTLEKCNFLLLLRHTIAQLEIMLEISTTNRLISWASEHAKRMGWWS